MSASVPAVVCKFPVFFVLTDREKEVANLIARGLTGKEIGKALGIGQATVDTHRFNLMKKIGVSSAAEVTHFAIWARITPLMDFSKG